MTLAFTLTVEELEALMERAAAKVLASDDTAKAKALPDVMTRDQAAEYLQVNAHQLPKLIEKKGLPAHRFGEQWRFLKAELLDWVARGGKAPIVRPVKRKKGA